MHFPQICIILLITICVPLILSQEIESENESDKSFNRQNLSGFRQFNCISREYYDDFNYHPCNRRCRANEPPRTCYYKLSLTNFESHNPEACSPNCIYNENCYKCIITDEIRSKLQVANYLFPGPAISVCLNDQIIVDVANHLDDHLANVSRTDLVMSKFQTYAREFEANNVSYYHMLALDIYLKKINH